MPPTHTTIGPLRSWVHVPQHLTLSTPTTSRLCSLTSSPPPSSLKKGLRATKKNVSFFPSPSPPSISTRQPTNIRPPSSLKKGLRATKKNVSFLRSPSPPCSATSIRPRFVLPGESSPRKSSYRLGDTTTFIPNHLDLTNISPTRRSAFFTALQAVQDLIDNPPSSTSPSPVDIQPYSPIVQSSPPIVPQPTTHSCVTRQSSSPIVQSPPLVVPQPTPQSPVAHRSPSPPRQSDFFAALKAVQDLIDNPPPPLSKSPVLSHHSPSPVVVKSPLPRFQATSPIAAESNVKSPILSAALYQPTRPIRKVFISVSQPTLPASPLLTTTVKPSSPRKSLGAAWIDSRVAPTFEFLRTGEDRKDRTRVLKWAADLPTPIVDNKPRPTALQELPISPLSSSFFRSSIGAPSPSPSPSSQPVSLPSPESRFGCSSGSSANPPSTPKRPSGFLDWWFDSLTPITTDHVPSVPPCSLENLSPAPSSLFRSSLGAPEESLLQISDNSRSASQSPTQAPPRSPPKSASPYPAPASPCSYTPSLVLQRRLDRPCVIGPDFSPPPGGLRQFGKLAAPSYQPLRASSQTAASSSSPFLGIARISIASIVGIAAGAFTLGCLATRYLF